MSSPAILITGATGNNGAEVVRQLSARGAPLRALVRDPARRTPLRLPGVEIAAGDFLDPPTLDRALEGVEKVFLVSPPGPDQVRMQNNVVEAARRTGTVRHIVKLSSLGAAPDSPVRFGRWNGETEQQIEASGIAWTHLRPNNFLQGLLMFAPMIRAQGRVLRPARRRPRFVGGRRDIAAVAAAVLTAPAGHENQAYALTGPEALTGDEIAQAIAAAAGRDVRYVPIEPEAFRQGALGRAPLRGRPTGLSSCTRRSRRGWARSSPTRSPASPARRRPPSRSSRGTMPARSPARRLTTERNRTLRENHRPRHAEGEDRPERRLSCWWKRCRSRSTGTRTCRAR
jgi:uncharacterized protein YbjT (DUF2867 family)